MSGSIYFHVDGASWVTCHAYGRQRTPILSVSCSGLSLSIAGDDRASVADQLQFARELAAETAAFLGAMEEFASAARTAD
ncbi:hypothetical protein GCM10010441_46730 [Kitasatospora paracochleata]|uniref:Uncharacterized protein n=1 Tax=Kitasatospora paracochleata TaxID=58354 RepID=A0ABT1J854_9ACTN|nr:hypothetical protein [Kitasatospora paracochleata]MCP2312911.1 hypothetical protein [Kitasatospora paracochleata]